jgi:hypothetical protein
LKLQVLFSVDRFTQSGNFENLLELNQTLLPKENFLLMDCSTCAQIYKNYEDQQVFVSREQIELINSVSRLENFLVFSLIFIPF